MTLSQMIDREVAKAVAKVLAAYHEHGRAVLTVPQERLWTSLRRRLGGDKGGLPLDEAMSLDGRVLPGLFARGLVRWEEDDDGNHAS